MYLLVSDLFTEESVSNRSSEKEGMVGFGDAHNDFSSFKRGQRFYNSARYPAGDKINSPITPR